MSKKKNSRKKYTGKEIRAARQEDNREILVELAKLLAEGKEQLSISEAEAASSILGCSRPADSICMVDLATIPGAQNYIFGVLYRAYHRDLEGERGITKFSRDLRFPERIATIEEKKEDVIRLNEYRAKWEKILEKNNYSDQVLNLVINETRKDHTELDRMLAAGATTKAEYDYKRKGIVLLSKYLYLKVKAIEEDYTSEELLINFNGIEIHIEPWSMVHILNRHYAQAAKQFSTGKSYHSDESIRFFEQPDQLADVLAEVGKASEATDVRYIPFRLNGVIYAVYTEDKIGHRQKERYSYKRLQTFYPIECETQLKDLEENYMELKISESLSAFIKN